MITFVIPDHMKQYRENRVEAGLSNKVSIDPCIVDEIKELWGKGISTRGCCCGHNVSHYSAYVNVADEDIDKMLEMGYHQEHYDPTRKDTFLLKSV